MMPHIAAVYGLLLPLTTVPPLLHAAQPPIVVKDLGGASALPYYEALSLQARSPGTPRPPIALPSVQVNPATEADMLPVRSPKLTPGTVARRIIDAPGLQPFFLVGDDEASHVWLQRQGASLRERGAVGLVVNVETEDGLVRLRAAAPGLQLAPVAADDLAERLGLRHYPVLITSTGIEQ
ncbi:integrating conjugative element protein [Pectobacterium aroidearum]|uniref:Integrating conjugative element protein n=1 Tax=Pectobacterium zantedeschiae TaxID=2034769 RepID=A0A9X8P418_9GAMM|nr:integrating conjugative element protein [Pectobacterium zantedeschiae]RYC41448.1 integrating conjugative element protein [Pectobacterium zantedeschiae]RYC46730.1 integrating conjugative element protein [Pectobacterium zantedeschiae]